MNTGVTAEIPAGDVDLDHVGKLIAFASLAEMRSTALGRLLSTHTVSELWALMVRGKPIEYASGAQEREVPRDRARRWQAELRGAQVAQLARVHLRAGVGVTSVRDAAYPSVLRSGPEAPGVLFWSGDLSLIAGVVEAPARRRVAIVGTRNATPYGRQIARSLGKSLSEHGIHVVSGLAAGIDGCAHHGVMHALETALGTSTQQVGNATLEGTETDGAHLRSVGRPVAVVGCGIDWIYPSINRSLWGQVQRHGLIVSEWPLGVRPLPWHFPERNRIIVGLSELVVAVESGLSGGSITTINKAIERNVPAMAVAGPITSPASAGTNHLLGHGAAVCTGVQSILEQLHEKSGQLSMPLSTPFDARRPPAETAAVVLRALGWDVLSTESLLSRVHGLSPGGLLLTLSELEFDGWVARGSEGWFQLAPSGGIR
jgi:DNA processing protein